MSARLSRAIPMKYRPITTIESLREHIQAAFTVEFSTVPPYLTALYSMKDKSTYAYKVMRSVVLEEMFHMIQASNLMNAVGASPLCTGDKVPEYPTYVPGHAAGGPYVQLMPATSEQFTTTFMPIEEPAPYHAPAEGADFDTIGQFYKAIEQGFELCAAKYGESELFSHDTGFQRTDYYFGSAGGTVLYVDSLKSAKLAINEIVQQGEGAVTPDNTLVPTEDWGTYEHYGLRSDGTYGPILGTPRELSHYYKFKAIAEGKLPTGDLYPMMANPRSEMFESDNAQQVAAIFNGCYSVMLKALQLSLGSNTQPDPFFTVGFSLMEGALPQLAVQLMQMPALDHGNASLGPTAGPPFVYVDTTLNAVLEQTSEFKDKLSEAAHGDATLQALVATLSTVCTTLEGIRRKTAGLAL